MQANTPSREADAPLELLLFRLRGPRRYGINILKVQEIVPRPTLTRVPQAHAAVSGVATLRGVALSVVDLAAAIGLPPRREAGGFVIVSEFNRRMQGFLVEEVDRIVSCAWAQVHSPPAGTGSNIYASAVTRVDDELVQILDVERVLSEAVGAGPVVEDVADLAVPEAAGARVLVVDDSSVARAQTARTLAHLGIDCAMARDGREALAILQGDVAAGGPPPRLVISDIEMPAMDGYALTRSIRGDARLQHLYVVLHTSLNGAINLQRASAAGADAALTKFVPRELAAEVVKGLRARAAA